jgi:hypothetical protein
VADELPKLPVRAAIYLLPDGTVQFGALFAELLPVARALGSDAANSRPPTEIRHREVSVDVPEIREAGR